MSEVRYYTALAEDEGQRLDNYLIRLLKGVPKSYIYRIIRGGEVRVNKKRAQASTRLIVDDHIRVPPVRMSEKKEPWVSHSLEEKISQWILFEDKDLLVVNKPAGMAVHGGSGLSLGIIEALRKIRLDLSYLELIHRLDRETSGCLLLAKKRSVLRSIQTLFAAREVKKTYWALVDGHWTGPKTCEVSAPLKKNILKSGERMVLVDPAGKPSETSFKLLENFKECCLVEAQPKTGRTHQIRVHSCYLKHPILGDIKYRPAILEGTMQKSTKRLYLHARSIQFTLNDQIHKYEAKPDESFVHTLQKLRAQEKAGA